MSYLKFSFPSLYYLRTHRRERGGYIYSDDLFNPHMWRDGLRQWDSYIESYIKERESGGQIDKTLHTVDLPSDVRSTSHETFQTMVGDLMNHYVNTVVGTVIVNQYEHYRPSGSSGPPSEARAASITNVDQLVKTTAEFANDLSVMSRTLNDNARSVVSPMKIEFHERYIDGAEDTDNILVSNNPNFQKFLIFPEMIGVDVAKMSSGTGSSDRYPVEFTAASLLGWNYTSPQERTLGCPGDLGSIISDIIWQTMSKNFGGADSFSIGQTRSQTGQAVGNIRYLFKMISPLYETLVTSSLIGALTAHDDDFGSLPGDDDSSRVGEDPVSPNWNPMVLGVRRNQARVPDAYGLWSIYRAVRTPFYNRLLVEQGTSSIDVERFFPFDIKLSDSGFQLEPRSTQQHLSESIKPVKNAIMKNLKASTKLAGFSQSSDFNTAVTTETKVSGSDLANKSLERLYAKLDSQNDTFWKNLVTYAIGNIGTNLLTASQISWGNLAQKLGESGLFGSTDDKVVFKKDNKIIEIGNTTLSGFRAASANAYISLQSVLRSAFGSSRGTAMGGTSLQGNVEINSQRFSEQVVYPGDASVMESVASYLDLLNSDIGTLGSRLQVGLENMSSKYWRRDVLRWLEVLFSIFKFNNPDELSTKIDQSDIRLKFSQLSRILKIMYTKQLGTIKDMLQKVSSLERRIKTAKGVENSGIERQAKMTSLFASTSICYMKIQILIVYYLLKRLEFSRYMSGPSARYSTALFSSNSRKLQNELTTWFKIQISDLSRNITNPQLSRTIQVFAKDICGDKPVDTAQRTSVSNKHMSDETTNEIVSDPRFWLLAIANMKGKDPSTVATDPASLKQLFIPIYEKVGGNRRYYLFDIIPFLIKGTFTGTFNSKSPPIWYTAKDISSTNNFTESNPAYVILSNTSSQLTNFSDWKAVDIVWFQNLVNKANAFASKAGNPDRKLWVIRFSMYLFLSDSEIYRDVTRNSGSSITKDVDTVTSEGQQPESRMKKTLKALQISSYEQKRSINKFVNMISREMFSVDLSNAKLVFQTA